MNLRGGELVATNEPAVVSETLFDVIVVEDSESDGRFSDSSRTNESDWSEGFSDTNNPFDHVVASETSSRPRGRRLSEYAGCEIEWLGSLIIEAADLV